jgi:hypothetical protein
MNMRHRLLAAALVVTLVAAFWPASENDVGIEVVERSRPAGDRPAAESVPVQPAKPEPQTRAVAAERLAKMQANLFPSQTWVPPPPPPKPYVPPPPPPPKPPPLPFKYLGQWVDAGQLTIFLVQGEQPIPVQIGQVLPGSWRVDEISERQVVFTYLPLDMQTTLGITP